LASIEWVIAIAGTMVALLLLANLVLVRYADAAVTAAAGAGARAGAQLGGEVADCEAAAFATLRGATGLLRGPVGAAGTVACVAAGPDMVVTVTVAVPWLVGGLAPVPVEHTERRSKELAP